MNKHGFTLIELLSVLVIISLISGIAVVSITSTIEKSKTKSFETYENTMYSEVMGLMLSAISDPNSEYSFPRNYETLTFNLSDMIEKNEIDSFRNPRNKNDLCLDSYVEVNRFDYDDMSSTHVDALEYKVCLICKNSNYNVDGNNCKFFPERDANATPRPTPRATPTPPGPILVDAFSSVTISGVARFNETIAANVITNSDGVKTYQWYYNTGNSTSGGTPITNATNSTLKITQDLIGKYVYVKVSIAKSDIYKAAPDAYAITPDVIGKAINSVQITSRTYTYDGNGKLANATALAGVPSITYFSDTNCTTKTTTTNAVSVGGSPKNAGTYYAIATVDESANYELGQSGCTKAVIIDKAQCNAPTNVNIAVDGSVTWVASSNCPGATYQVSMSPNSGYVTHISGNVVAEIVSETGTRTLYVKAISSNANYTDSIPVSKSTTVYSVTLAKGACSSVTGAGNYISGGTATITATRTNPYYFVNWTGSATYTNISQTIMVDGNKSFIANCDDGCSSGNISCTTTNGSWGSCSVTYKDQTGTHTRTNTTTCVSTRINNYTCSTSTSSESGSCNGSSQRYTVNCKCNCSGTYDNTGSCYIGAGSCDSACDLVCYKFGIKQNGGVRCTRNSTISCSSGASSSMRACPW